jgi:hypothetical protein
VWPAGQEHTEADVCGGGERRAARAAEAGDGVFAEGCVKLVLPLPLNLANSRMHWRVKQREKRDYWEKLDLLFYAKQLPPPPRKAPLKARIHATLYLHSPMDDGNAMNRMKWIEDWLKAWGYITDDSKKHLEWMGFPEQVIDRKNPRVEVELEAA